VVDEVVNLVGMKVDVVVAVLEIREVVVMGLLLLMPRLKLSSAMIIVAILVTMQEYIYLICHLM
jgi:hypothetical protein